MPWAGLLPAEPPIEVGALLGQEARLVAIGPPVLDVDLALGDVEVTGDEHVALGARSTTAKGAHTPLHGVEEPELLILLRGASLARVDVCGHHGDHPQRRLHVDLDPASLPRELRDAEALADRLGLRPRQDRDAVATQALRRAVGDMQMRQSTLRELLVHLLVRGAHLLEADDVRIEFGEPGQATTSRRGTDAVDVGGDGREGSRLACHARRLGHRLLQVVVDGGQESLRRQV